MYIGWNPTRSFGRSPQQLDIAHNVSDRPLAHLSDEVLRMLVENARQPKEAAAVQFDTAREQAKSTSVQATSELVG